MKILTLTLIRKWTICTSAAVIIPSFLFAQQYTPFRHQPELLVAKQQQSESRHKAGLEKLNGDYKKEITAEYQKRFEHIQKIYRSKQLVTDPVAVDYLDKLVNRIRSANPAIKTLPFAVHFSRAYWPNAVSYGEGTILFNISLFSRLQNESQAAFVLCHELAHYYLDHSNRSIREYVNTVNSAAFKEELKAIEKTTYLRNKRADELIKNLSYTNRRHGRMHETEADSLALEFLLPTGYDVREALSCLALLDSIDLEKHAGNLALKQQINFPGYPFRPRWTKLPSPSLSEAMMQKEEKQEAVSDSLKTHPDCKKRIEALRKRVQAIYQPSQQLFLVSHENFVLLADRFDAELVEYCLDAEETGRALYYALQLFHAQPDNVWLATTIGRCLNILFNAQRTHNLGNMIDPPGNKDNPEYDEYLRFLQHLRLDEIAAISYHFMQQQSSGFGNDETFKKVLAESRSIYNNPNQ
jgi:predicted Zn-dependent protease